MTETTTETKMLTLTVRMAPPRELSPNASLFVKTGQKNRLREEWKKAWAWAGYAALATIGHPIAPYFPGPVRVVLTYLRGRNAKPWDADNLIATCKQGVDQIAPVGVIANDKQIVAWSVNQAHADDGIGIVVVTIEEAS